MGAKMYDFVRELMRLMSFLPGGFDVFGIIFASGVVIGFGIMAKSKNFAALVE